MLSVSNLNVHYGPIHAVKNVSFEVGERQIISILGSNGAGKSSTLAAILRLIKSSGEISFLGYDTARHKAQTLVKRGISLVPEGRRIFKNLTIEENLRLGAFHNEDNYEHLKEQMYRLFPRLKDKNNAQAGNLSGGEAQMLAISRALMSEPKLLMLDEPSLGLAPKIIYEVFDIILALREEGITILLVEQNAHIALRHSDRALVLENGRVALEDKASSLLADDEVRKKYLGL